MDVALVTRGFEQQLDYNVIKRERPFGDIVHGRMDVLGRYKTTANDFCFSFVVRCDGPKWEMLINCIPTVRHDFSGSALRTYLYLSGDKCGEDDWQIAKNILLSEVAAWWPKQQLPDRTPLGRVLDSVLTNDVIKGFVGWKGSTRIDAVQWVESRLKPAIKGAFTTSAELGKVALEEFALGLETISKSSGVVTGEFLPYLLDSDEDDSNLTLHYSSGRIVRVLGSEKVDVGESTQSSRDLFHQSLPSPTPMPSRNRWGYAGFVALIVVLGGLLLKSCQRSSRSLKDSISGLSLNNKTTNTVSIVKNTLQ